MKSDNDFYGSSMQILKIKYIHIKQNKLILLLCTLLFVVCTLDAGASKKEKKEKEVKEERAKKGNGKNGKITINPFPDDGVKIFIDGDSTDWKTLRNMTIGVGKHTIRLKKEGFLEESKTIKISKKGIQSVNFHMNPGLADLWKEEKYKYKNQKKLWLYSAIITSGVGTYFFYESDNLFYDYQAEDPDSIEAFRITNKIRVYDGIYYSAYGVAGICLLKYILTERKFLKTKKKIETEVTATPKGGKLLMRYKF